MRTHILLNTIKYAAVFCLIFGLGYYSSINSESLDEPQKIIPKSNDIVLTSDDSKVILEKDDNKTDDKKIISKINLIQKSDQLIYDNNIDIKELVYHSLKVPYGKRFNVVFSDGSKAYVAKKYYKVRAGDTLSAIAERNRTSVSSLCRLNGLRTTSILQIGQNLRVK